MLFSGFLMRLSASASDATLIASARRAVVTQLGFMCGWDIRELRFVFSCLHLPCIWKQYGVDVGCAEKQCRGNACIDGSLSVVPLTNLVGSPQPREVHRPNCFRRPHERGTGDQRGRPVVRKRTTQQKRIESTMGNARHAVTIQCELAQPVDACCNCECYMQTYNYGPGRTIYTFCFGEHEQPFTAETLFSPEQLTFLTRSTTDHHPVQYRRTTIHQSQIFKRIWVAKLVV